MPLQRINGIVGGADQGNVGSFDQAAYRPLVLQLLVAQIPYLLCGISAQMAGVAKVSLQLQMAPVVQRIADKLFQGLSPFLEFLAVSSISGDIFFIDTIGTHLTPFVVISAQPYLGNVFKFSVFCDFSGVDMTMVIQNWHFFCVIVE